MIAGWLAAVMTLGGTLCLYAASPHQVLVAGGLARRPGRLAGSAQLLAALGLLLTVQGAATAIFTWATGAMLVWSIVPVVARWWRFRQEPGR